jgi:hypothetical protein
MCIEFKYVKHGALLFISTPEETCASFLLAVREVNTKRRWQLSALPPVSAIANSDDVFKVTTHFIQEIM